MILATRESIILKIINHNWGNSFAVKIIDYGARGLILILFFDEMGLFLKEWGLHIFVFDYFREVLSFRWVSYLTFLANYIILIPATYNIIYNYFDRLEYNEDGIRNSFNTISEFVVYKKSYSLISAYLLLSVSNLFWFGQCVIWDEVKIEGATFFSASTILIGFIFLLSILLLIFNIKKIDRLDNQYILGASYLFSKKKSQFILAIFFLTFSQTMITKVIVLLPLIEKLKSLGVNWISTILPKEKISEDFLIPLKTSNKWNLFNFLFLTCSTFSLIVFWQTAVTPFPPLDSFYPKAYTISLFYMLYILLYFILFQNNQLLKIKSIIWIIITSLILYVLPLKYTSLFVNLSGEKFTNGSMIGEMYSLNLLGVLILTILFLHLLAILLFYIVFKILQLNELLFSKKFLDKKLFRYYFFISSYMNSITLLSFLLLFLLMLSTSYEYKTLIAYEFINIKEIYFISLLPIIIFLYDISRNTPQIIYDKIKKNFGNDIILKVINQNRYLIIFKSWNNNKRSFLGFLFFFLSVVFVSFTFFVVIYILPHSVINSKTKLIWSTRLKPQDFGYEIKELGNELLIMGFKGVYCIEQSNGNMRWQKKGTMPAILNFSNDRLWVIDNQCASLVKSDNGKILNELKISAEVKNKDKVKEISYEVFRKAGNYLVLKSGKNLFFINGFTGKINYHISNLDSPLPIIKGGVGIWKNKNGEIHYYDKIEKKVPNLFFNKEVKQIVSLEEVLLLISNDSTYCFDYGGVLKWKDINFVSRGKFHYSDYIIKDSLIVYAVNSDSIFGISKLSGKIKWKILGHSYWINSKPLLNNLLVYNNKGFLLYNEETESLEFYNYDGFKTSFISTNEFLSYKKPDVVQLNEDGFYTLSLFNFKKYSLDKNEYLIKDHYSLDIKKKYPDYFESNVGFDETNCNFY